MKEFLYKGKRHQFISLYELPYSVKVKKFLKKFALFYSNRAYLPVSVLDILKKYDFRLRKCERLKASNPFVKLLFAQLESEIRRVYEKL